jgi:hypothetical protein
LWRDPWRVLRVLVLLAVASAARGDIPRPDPPLTGRVVEAGTARPVPNVHVSFLDTAGRELFKSVSDATGRYNLLDWYEPGTVVYSSQAYETRRLRWPSDLSVIQTGPCSCEVKDVYLSLRHMSR